MRTNPKEKLTVHANLDVKLQFFNKLARDQSGGANTGLGPGSPLGAEISVQGVDGRIQNQVAVGAGFEMAFDLVFDGCGEPPL